MRADATSDTHLIFFPLIFKNYLLCDHIIGQTVSVADARTDCPAIKPGDTICIAAGARGDLKLKNFQGTAENPIVIVNFGGQVVIDSDTSHGILFQNSRFFRLTGTGDGNIEYGIKIVNSTNVGVQAGYKSSNLEIDHVEISGARGAGIMAKSETLCSDGSNNDYDYDADGTILNDLDDVVNRDNFTQYDSVFHDNYVHDVGMSGFYIGSSFYQGKEVSCNSGPVTLYDPVLRGVNIYNNRVADTGMDGIQVGSATEDCSIHHNEILRDSRANEPYQQSGVMNNPGSVCNIYNNFIQDGGGPGLFVQGNGGNIIYNNVIVNAGQNESLGSRDGNGITIYGGSNPGNSIYVLNNTIVTPKNFGIKFRSDRGSDNRIQNNIIAAPGNYDSHGDDAYIQTDGRVNVSVSNNLESRTPEGVKFTEPTLNHYSIQSDSPAVDSGINWDLGVPAVDYAGTVRPQGLRYDIGAYEFVP